MNIEMGTKSLFNKFNEIPDNFSNETRPTFRRINQVIPSSNRKEEAKDENDMERINSEDTFLP